MISGSSLGHVSSSPASFQPRTSKAVERLELPSLERPEIAHSLPAILIFIKLSLLDTCRQFQTLLMRDGSVCMLYTDNCVTFSQAFSALLQSGRHIKKIHTKETQTEAGLLQARSQPNLSKSAQQTSISININININIFFALLSEHLGWLGLTSYYA